VVSENVRSSASPAATALRSTTQGFLTRPELCARWRISRMTLWRWLRTGHVPHPVHFGPRTVKWLVHEIETFERRLADDRAVGRRAP